MGIYHRYKRIHGCDGCCIKQSKSAIKRLKAQRLPIKGVEKYRECLECKGKGHQHCVAMSGIPYVAPCDHCETGEIVEPILFDEVEHSMDSYFQQRFTSDKWSRDDVDEVEFIRANLKPHLKEWRVRKEKP